MGVATIRKDSARTAPTSLSAQRSLSTLQHDMSQATMSAASLADLLPRLADILRTVARATALYYFRRNDLGEWIEPLRWDSSPNTSLAEHELVAWKETCEAACRRMELEIRSDHATSSIVVVAPIVRPGQLSEAVGIVFSVKDVTPHLMLLAQLTASHVMLWQATFASRANDTDLQDSAALIELVEHVLAAPTLRDACYRLAGELATFLPCQKVAIGLRTGRTGRCRLAAISGSAHFEKWSQTAQAIESAMDEAALRGESTQWPPGDATQRHAVLAHKNLGSLVDAKFVLGTPLRHRDGQTVGALLVWDDRSDRVDAARRFVRLSETSLAASLDATRRLDGGRLVRLGRAARQAARSWKSHILMAALGLILAAMWIPVPYRMECDCQLEPVTRRFIAAPFEGTLEKSFAKPGDMVRAGQVLACLDGREIRWKRAGIAADYDQAVKKRDVAQATHNYAEQQIAQLEMKRLELELQLLDHRATNLEIKSPVAGVVISGDLQRAEGAPVEIGQTLFEIGPLEQMIVEVAVPDEEVSHVTSSQSLDIRLDAYPGQSFHSVVSRIAARSEIRDHDNVFVAEGELDNTAGTLRPGMKGQARVRGSSHALGWVLFHKPWEYVSKKIAW